MAAGEAVYQRVRAQVEASGTGWAKPQRTRWALLVAGIIVAQSVTMRQVAKVVAGWGVTRTGQAASLERRIRRTLDETGAEPAQAYRALVQTSLDWEACRRSGEPVVLIVDETTQQDRWHLVRVSVAYRGSAIPLAWRGWAQNQPLPEGAYWEHLQAVLEEAKALVPADLAVIVVADRAYGIPTFLDRVHALGWQAIVRLTTTGTHRIEVGPHPEQALKDFLAVHLAAAGRRWKGRVRLFKAAGWHDLSLVALWQRGQREPLVVISALPPTWPLLRTYSRRFWTEPAFRTDKSRGWHWEQAQITDPQHHAVLLLAMAWASLLTLLAGAAEAGRQLAALATRPARHHACKFAAALPRHARDSLFQLGLDALLHAPPALAPPLPLARLPDLTAPAWNTAWLAAQRHRFLHAVFQTVRP